MSIYCYAHSNKEGVAPVERCLGNSTDTSVSRKDIRIKDAFKKGTFQKGLQQDGVLEFYRVIADQQYEKVGGTKEVLELTNDDDDDDDDDGGDGDGVGAAADDDDDGDDERPGLSVFGDGIYCNTNELIFWPLIS